MKAQLLHAAVLLLVSLSLEGGAIEDAVKSLGDENFKHREQAEAQLKEAGFGALPLVEPLLLSEDPEIALRAKRIRDWVICGIDERIPAALAADLPRFDALPMERRSAVVSELAGLKPPHVSGLVNLHSRLFAMRLTDDERGPLLAMVENGIRSSAAPKDLAKFGQWPLHIRTRALLVNLAASRQAAGLRETYAAWHKREPGLRAHLDGNAVMLEVDRLRAAWDKRGALAFVAEIRDEQAFLVLVKEFRDWMLGDPGLKLDELGETEAIAYLELTFESATPGDALPLFRKLRDRVPGLGEKLRESRKEPLQALRLWESGKHAEAAEALCAKDKEIRNGIEFLGQMILDTDDVNFAAVLAPIAPQSAAKLVGIALREPVSDRGLARALELSAFLRSQGVPTQESAFSGQDAESLALDLWKNGQDDLCYRVMGEVFWGADDSDEWNLSHFPAMASAMGRIDDALETAKKIPSGNRYLELKSAYLHRAAGQTTEAIAFSEKTPDSAIHRLLLLESRNWAELAKTGKGNRHFADWFACLNGDREEWRGNVPEPEKKSAHLRLMLDDHASLFSEALENGGAGVSGAHYAKVLAGDLLLRKLQGKDAEKPAPYAPPGKPSPADYEIMEPKVGDLGDPRADDFAVLDGLARSSRLWESGDGESAKTLLMEMVIRIALDGKLRNKPTRLVIKSGGISSGSGHPADILMRGCLAEGTPREIGLAAARAISLLCPDPAIDYISKPLHESTALVYAKHGDLESACREYHRFFVLGLSSGFHYKHIRETAGLVELEIRRSLASGLTKEAVETYARHHRLMPYDTRLTDDILGKLRAAGDEDSARRLDLIVTGFWEEKLEGLPDAGPYQKTLSHWKNSFAKP